MKRILTLVVALFFLSLLSVSGVDFGDQKSNKFYNPELNLRVEILEHRYIAYRNLMPGAPRNWHVIIPLRIENLDREDLYNLKAKAAIFKVREQTIKSKVFKEEKQIGGFIPVFQIDGYSCQKKPNKPLSLKIRYPEHPSFTEPSSEFVDDFNLPAGCRIDLHLRAWRDSDWLLDFFEFTGKVKIRFIFGNSLGSSPVYETETTVKDVY